MSLRTDTISLSGLAPKKYTEMRTVYSGKNTYWCFFNRDDRTNSVVFVSGIQMVVDADCREILTRFMPTLPDDVAELINNVDWENL